MDEGNRLPDIVIIGAKKSATSSLFWWLERQPEISMAHPKETDFFTRRWSDGPSLYAQKFAEASPGQILGEASVSYTDPSLSPLVADRMANLIPDVRLIYVIRHPVERTRSDYRHEVQRHREPQPLLDALREPGNRYLGESCYYTCLAPYVERFSREQILVVRFEDLTTPPSPAWPDVLRFLSLPPDRPVPEEAHNLGHENAQWSWALSWVLRHRLIGLRRIARFPKPIRRVGKRLFTRGDAAYQRRLEASMVPIPDELLEPVWGDVARLEDWLGTHLWSPSGDSVSEATG